MVSGVVSSGALAGSGCNVQPRFGAIRGSAHTDHNQVIQTRMTISANIPKPKAAPAIPSKPAVNASDTRPQIRATSSRTARMNSSGAALLVNSNAGVGVLSKGGSASLRPVIKSAIEAYFLHRITLRQIEWPKSCHAHLDETKEVDGLRETTVYINGAICIFGASSLSLRRRMKVELA